MRPSEQLQVALVEKRKRSMGTATPGHLVATGDCYADCANKLVLSHKNWVMVHGRPTLQRAPYVEYGHAWLEKGEQVYDPTSGYKGPRYMYYAMGQIDHRKNLVYTAEEARHWLLASKHYGPWEGPDGTPVPPASKKEYQARGFKFRRSKRSSKPKTPGVPKKIRGKLGAPMRA
jgi:hypothetical protein